jgi:uncharacterized membrane protein
MKNFNNWLYAISMIFLVTVIVDINVFWLLHPANKRPGGRMAIILLSVILIAIVATAIYRSNKRKK